MADEKAHAMAGAMADDKAGAGRTELEPECRIAYRLLGYRRPKGTAPARLHFSQTII